MVHVHGVGEIRYWTDRHTCQFDIFVHVTETVGPTEDGRDF